MSEPSGPLWAAMNQQPRVASATLTRQEVPARAGVYAWYEAGIPIYVGEAGDLRERLCGDHLGEGAAMGNSAFRRNVAEDLGIASARAIKSKEHRLNGGEVDQVNAMIQSLSLAWTICETKDEAVALEDRMKREWKPRLNKK
jgi:excinuclease UvrABC nuclease subunit